jgi:hypothetical protein
MMHLKPLEKQEQDKPHISRWKEIIKFKTEIHKMYSIKNINKTNKPIFNHTRRREKQINEIREKRDITTNTNKMQSITRYYFENLYSNKLGNL